MATILLQAAGGFVGGLLGGPFGAVAGRALGALGGFAIDNGLMGGSKTRRVEGPRLGAARILDADEGAGIARLYGTARIAGQVIWTTHFEEDSQTRVERSGGKGSGGGQRTETTTYSYHGNVAIGLCEGPIAGIRRVWADGEELDLDLVTWRLHRGGVGQMPDPLIEAKQGAGNAPAYRGLAYIVFERLALESFGNRIPQISCEVIRPVGDLEPAIRAVTIIPGASEHGLDPLVVRETRAPGEDRLVNRAVLHGASDFEASLDELQGLCPALERAALVVGWFGTDLRAGRCEVKPGVESAARTEFEPWRAGSVGRGGAHLVSRSNGGPAYGGTPSDAGVLRAIADLKARGLKVTLYPFLLMDVPAANALPDPYGAAAQAPYPWRGRMTLDIAPGRPGSPDRTSAARSAVAAFVGTAQAAHFSLSGGSVSYTGPAEWSFRRMVLHQAHLAKAAGGVDAFVIASEMRGLTRLRDAAGAFPFVEALTALAADVKAVLPGARITYAADWSEYFGYQPADGSNDVFFNLDPLWAHPAIDMIGIDNYLPTSDWRIEDAGGAGPDAALSPYDAAALRRGIAGGERAEWFYASDADRRARRRTPITDGAAGKPWVFRPKDLVSWWSLPHVERHGGVEVAGPSPWVPKSKPIWFTELGCPAIDKGANQPNVFLDPKSAESLTPHFSTGAPDDLIQRRFIEAHLKHWDPALGGFVSAANPISPIYGGRMVEPSAIHLWTWDARPYPAFPERTDIWSDGGNWRRGHWLTGRLGRAPLAELIRRLLAEHGFPDADVSGVDALVGGYIVSGPGSARAELEELLRLCGIVAHASAGRLVFRSLAGLPAATVLPTLAEENEDRPLVQQRRLEDSDTAEEVVVGFSDPARFYQSAAAEAVLTRRPHPRKTSVELPVVLDELEARRFAAAILADDLDGRDTARFSLGPNAVSVEAGDVVSPPGLPGRWLVTRIEDGETRRIEARRLADSARETADGRSPTPPPLPKQTAVASRPVVELLDLPLGGAAMAGGAPRIAVHSRPYRPVVVEASAGGGGYRTLLVQRAPSTIGRLAAELKAGPEGRIDPAAAIEVDLLRGTLASVERSALLSGANLCAVRCRSGGLEVLQFQTAEEIAPGRFRLRTLLRALGGTEDAMRSGAAAGSSLVRLDAATSPLDLPPDEVGRPLDWRFVPAGLPFDDPAAVLLPGLAMGMRALLPLSPVHLRARFAADGTFTLDFIRRTRVGGDGWDGLDVPLGEEIERYRATVSTESGGVLVREIGTPSLTLTSAEQLAAFGSLPARLDVEVCQLSLAAGPGIARLATFRR